MNKYKKLEECLNELNLEDMQKITIIEAFNLIGIDLDICSKCMDITVGGVNDGCETYCSVECLEYDSYADTN